jgi:polyisoprenoid-binding protein YceI
MSVVDGASGASVVPAGKWSVDAPPSSVAFAVKHMMVATVNGRFREFAGMLEAGSGAPRATGVVKAASIDTNEPTEEHRRGAGNVHPSLLRSVLTYRLPTKGRYK